MPALTDAFIISACSAADPVDALRQAIQVSGINPARVQDFIFGVDHFDVSDAAELGREVLINCPQVTVSSSLRALIFAAQIILCEDADLVLVGGGDNHESAALLLASPAVVGIYNLMPLARIEAHSLVSTEHAIKKAGRLVQDIEIKLEGTGGVLLVAQLVNQLQEHQAGLGLVCVGAATLLIERV